MFPEFAINHERLAQLYAFQGRFSDAIAQDTKARVFSGEDPKSALQKEAALRHALMAGGPLGYWTKLLEFSQKTNNPPESYQSPFGAAILYSHLGEKAKAFDSLEDAYKQRSVAMTELAVEPAFALDTG